MKNFWNFMMRKDLPENSLSGINYTIFGLGDSSYEKFNQVAIVLNKRLENLGGDLIYPVGLGDEQQDFGYETEFDPWCEGLMQSLSLYFPNKIKIESEILYNCSFDLKINILDNQLDSCYVNNDNLARVEKLKIITSNQPINEVFHIELQLNKEVKTNPGDVVLIYPKNSKSTIEQMLNICNLNPSDSLEFKGIHNYPNKVNAFEYFESYLDINGTPNR